MSKTLIENYEEIYEKAGNISEQTDAKETELFASLVEGKKNVLDIGCGEGELALALAKRGHKISLMDISKTYLIRATHLLYGYGYKTTEINADIEVFNSSKFSEYFDAIYLMDVIEHLRNPSCALVNIRKMLRDDGVLIINTPNSSTARKFAGYLLKPKKRADFWHQTLSLHLQAYDYSSLGQLLAFCGFEIKKIVPRSIFSRAFPKLGYNLLVICEKAKPLDAESIVAAAKNYSEAPW